VHPYGIVCKRNIKFNRAFVIFMHLPLMRLLYGLFSLAIAVLLSLSSTAIANPPVKQIVSSSPRPSSPPPPRPTKPVWGGGLGDTCNSQKPLTALILDGRERLTTISEVPTFWFYIPNLPDSSASLVFTVNTEDEKTQIYQTRLEVPNGSGIVGLRLPASIKLETNQTYYWYLRLNCNRKSGTAANETVEGNILKLSRTPALEAKVQLASPEVWYDALSMTAAGRLSKISTAEQDWQRLLNLMGMSELATEPILPIIILPEQK
jgi:hypothetical protein